MKTNATHLEISAAKHFGFRQNLIVPNVSWGFGLGYEADLVVVRPSRRAIEIEIKVSIYDLRKDLQKNKFRIDSLRFHQFYYLIPQEMEKYTDEILNIINPSAGLMIRKSEKRTRNGYIAGFNFIDIIRPAAINKQARKISDKEYFKLCELAAMRIWSLKEALNNKFERAK